MKNEHFIYCFGSNSNGKKIILIGLTDIGIKYINGTINAIPIKLPIPLNNVDEIIIFQGIDQETLKETLLSCLK